MPDFESMRRRMVDTQVAGRGVSDQHLLDAMRQVPREAFVEAGFEELAYDDRPLPIGRGQTISQPYVVALMIESAGIRPVDTVLEVGAGSGYAAAIMSRVARHVYAIERHAPLAEAARERLARLGFDNVTLTVGDGTRGWPEMAPFDTILVAAGGPEVPMALKEQLAVGGRLVIPVGRSRNRQTLLRVVRSAPDAYETDDLGAVMFVPLIGAHGWARRDRGSGA
jgi:protein-L-isoaspartate(D-aspartate) O-methyltransferase